MSFQTFSSEAKVTTCYVWLVFNKAHFRNKKNRNELFSVPDRKLGGRVMFGGLAYNFKQCSKS